MERDVATLVDLVNQAYPTLPVMTNLEEWMSSLIENELIFVQRTAVTEKGNSLTSTKVLTEAIIVLHYPKRDGKYQPLSVSPLSNILRNGRFSYRGTTTGLLIDVDPSTLRIDSTRRDRTEITFRFEYLQPVVRDQIEKIQEFMVEEG